MIEFVEIEMPDGTCDAWIARPEGDGPWPGVILSMDAVGPRPTLTAMAERLADEGYVVLMPNMFYREQRAPIVTGMPVPARVKDLPEILRQIMPLVDRFDPAAALRDTQTFIDDLAARQGVRPGPFGIFGYCMGGAMAIRTGAAFPDKFAAVASFHAGRLVTQDPQSPHRLLPKLRGALYVGHADQDPHMNTAQIKEFAEAAAELTIPHENELYEGAHHHFTMNDLPAYNKAAAEKAWRKLTALFEKALQPAK